MEIRGNFLLANSLTIARLLLGLAFPLLPASWRLPVAVYGALSDLFDGVVSRRLNATSEFGRVLDPIADKVFVVGVLLVLLLEGHLTFWQLALIGQRDLVVILVGGAVVLIRGRKALKGRSPTLLGKSATALQLVFIVSVLFLEQVHLALFVMTATVSGVAALDYLRVWITRLTRDEEQSSIAPDESLD